MLFEKALQTKISYNDVIELDGAFATTHINYGKSPRFKGVDGSTIAVKSRRNSITTKTEIKIKLADIKEFNGTEQNYTKEDRIQLWKSYWLEYINAFEKLAEILPDSVVTAYTGRQAIEIGLKYLLLNKDAPISRKHGLGEAVRSLFIKYSIKKGGYMDCVDEFCEKYEKYIEGYNPEYFRYPEYKKNYFFAGNRLDIKWLTYNFMLIILKLLHLAELDNEI